MRADELFVFAGAGASLSMPANLPVFATMRNTILAQLEMHEYVWRDGYTQPEKVAAGLLPEPFMYELAESGIDIEAWLSVMLSGAAPNAAHHALAQLAAAGSKVWTVNFDALIEEAAAIPLRSVAWPREPTDDAQLLKPHGSVGGELIVTAAQVIAKLGPGWLERLRSDVEGRTVIFVGYAGHDLDFQHIWRDVLKRATRVLWFDVWKAGRMVEEEHKLQLLRDIQAAGKLTLQPPAALPAGVSPNRSHNPSWDFVAWCQGYGLATVDSGLVLQLFADRVASSYPGLPGDRSWAKPGVQGLLGDYKAARRSYWKMTLRLGYQRKASRALAASYVMHGGNVMAALLAPAMILPSRGRLAKFKAFVVRRRVSAWARTGRNRAVLRATRNLADDAPSIFRVLRSQAMRVTGSLDNAAELAARARTRAAEELHPVLLANAAFQECLALLWAERLEDMRRCLDQHLRPYAELAANRWVAWADFVEAGWEVHQGHGVKAMEKYDDAKAGFTAEGLADGLVSVQTAELAAYRLLDDQAGYRKALAEVTKASRHGEDGARYYTRRNKFTSASIINDRAEFVRCSDQNLEEAWRLYQQTASCNYPLQQALGYLGLGCIQARRGQRPSQAELALDIAERIGFGLVAERSRELIAQPASSDSIRQIYFV